jgi:hypothetical protein
MEAIVQQLQPYLDQAKANPAVASGLVVLIRTQRERIEINALDITRKEIE